tara:strand:+ start:124 stop:1626 length:1503 start_codon:yes stop_codon:yes gene_type:complete
MNTGKTSSQSTLAPSEYQKRYTAGQIIKFDIPSFYGFIDPRQTFLRMNCAINSGLKCRLSKDLGGQALISAIRIYDYANSNLLENIENYGEIVKIMNNFGDNDSLRHQKQLLEGIDTETATGLLNRQEALFFNQYAPTSTNTTDIVTDKKVNDNVVQLAMKVHSGILGGDKVFPISAFGGLRVEIELNTASKALMCIGQGTSAAEGVALSADIAGGAVTTLDLALAPNQLPFCVGHKLFFKNNADAEKVVTILEIENLNTDESRITFASEVIGATDEGVKVHLSDFSTLDQGTNFALTNVELCLKQVIPPQSYVDNINKLIGSEEGFNIDIKTFDLIRSNILGGQFINELPISSYSRRVYAVLSLYTKNESDSLVTDSFKTDKTRIVKYSYAIDGRKNPNRDVNVELTAGHDYHINQQATFEARKALESCGITIRNLPLKNNFFVGRAMGQYGGVYPLKDHDLTLRTQFNSTGSEDLLVLNYICSLRRLVVNSEGVVVIQ